MKSFLLVLFVLLFISAIDFAQVREFESYRNSLLKISTHDKAALWPAQSFYQRKSEWQWIVDSTWGPGVSTSQKLNIFDTYANLIQTEFALFTRLNLDWDSLKTFWRSRITDNTSNGGLHQIMSHLAWTLKDGHSASWNIDISHMPLNPGTPLFVIVSYAVWDVSHFGACLTAGSEGEIFVFKAIDNHPLGLEPGDIILGYEGVKWMDIVEELMDFHIPIFGASSTNEEARNHDLLMSAGMNWHMFSIIDIVKYSTGDTLHLSLEPLLQLTGENMIYAEQMDIPGVPKPDYALGEQGSYGIIDNQNIGYIYIYDQNDFPGFQIFNFLEAVQNLYNTDGLIIDLRGFPGGFLPLEAGFDLLLNKKITELKYAVRCNGTNLYSLCETNSPWWDTTFTPNPQTFFQKPIAILVGPKCESMGDFTAYRFKSFPNGRFFGKTTAAAVGTSNGYYDFPGAPGGYNGWVFYTQIADTYHPDHPYQYLSGVEFPVDKKIWLTKEDVVNGFDTVVEEAVSWINNLSHSYNPILDKAYTQNEIQFTADVKNPSNHSLSINADILKNDIKVDSIDCTIAGNKTSGIWSVPVNNEDFYSVTIRTKDIEDTTIHTLPNILRFTNAGPLEIDSIAYAALTNFRYSIKPFIRNHGIQTQITNITVKLVCDDPWVTNITPALRYCPNLSPGQLAGVSSAFAVSYDSTTFPGYFNFKFEIMSNDWTYWTDTLILYDPNWNGIEDELSEVPTEYLLSQNYPNPFNSTSVIKYSIPKSSQVTLKIFNTLGQEIETLVDEEKSVGTYELNWNAANLPSGVYFYRLQAGDFIQTRKMILLK